MTLLLAPQTLLLDIERCCSRAAAVLGVLCVKRSLPGCSPLRLSIERLLVGGDVCGDQILGRQETTLNGIFSNKQQRGVSETKQQHWFFKNIGKHKKLHGSAARTRARGRQRGT
jgi:hypothetical protein